MLAKDIVRAHCSSWLVASVELRREREVLPDQMRQHRTESEQTRFAIDAQLVDLRHNLVLTPGPSTANRAAFDEAVPEVAAVTAKLLDRLVTSTPPRSREVEVEGRANDNVVGSPTAADQRPQLRCRRRVLDRLAHVTQHPPLSDLAQLSHPCVVAGRRAAAEALRNPA